MKTNKKTLQEQLEERTDAALIKVFEEKFSEGGIERMLKGHVNTLMHKSLLSILGLTDKWNEIEFVSDNSNNPHLLKGLIHDKVSVIRDATEKAFAAEIKAFKPTQALKKIIKDEFLRQYRQEFDYDLKQTIKELLNIEAKSIAKDQIAKYRKSVGLPTD